MDSPAPPDDAVEGDSSKLPEAAAEAGETPPGDSPGEQGTGAGDVQGDDVKEDEEDDDECGWGWWPLPPDTESSAPTGGDGYGGGAPSTAPPQVVRPGVASETETEIALPAELTPESPLPAVVAEPFEPFAVIVPAPAAPGVGGGGVGAGPRAPESPARPPAPSRNPPAERPAAPRTDGVLPASYRAGYGEYLRTAGMPQVIAVAVPGATGIMLLTGAGGLIGYRQARAGHAIRASGSARFSS